MVAKIREKTISTENPESMETKSKKRQKYEQTRREGRVNSMMRERSRMLMTQNIEDCTPPPLNCGNSSTL